MKQPKFSKLELLVMEPLWTRGALSIRQIQESTADRKRAPYTTMQTMVYRLEGKGAVRRAGKIGNAHIFEAVVSRVSAHRRVIDELLTVFGGQMAPLMTHLIDAGKLTHEDVQQAEKHLRDLKKKGREP